MPGAVQTLSQVLKLGTQHLLNFLYSPLVCDLAACLCIIHNKPPLPNFLTSTESNAESFLVGNILVGRERQKCSYVCFVSRSVPTVYSPRSPMCYFIAQCKHLFPNERTLPMPGVSFQWVSRGKNSTALKIFDINQDCPNLEVAGKDSSPKRNSQLFTHFLCSCSTPSGLLL